MLSGSIFGKDDEAISGGARKGTGEAILQVRGGRSPLTGGSG